MEQRVIGVRSLLAMALLVIGAGAVAPVQAAPASRRNAPLPDGAVTPQTPAAQVRRGVPLPDAVVAPPAGTTEQTVQGQYIGIVGWSYLRMHQPELIVGMIQDVQAGRLPQSALNGLASPPVLKGMLERRWDAASLPGAAPQEGSLAASARIRDRVAGAGAAAPAPGAALSHVMTQTDAARVPGRSAWETIRTQSALAVLADAPDYAPTRINFAPLWDGQSNRLRVHITAMADGPITAALPEEGPFRIAGMYAHDGTWRAPDTGIAVRSRLNILDGASRAVGTQGAASSRLDVLTAVRVPSASRGNPPWSLNAQAGQDVEIVIAFEPHFDLFKMAAGDYDASLQVTGRVSNPMKQTRVAAPRPPQWAIKIPVHGKFQGRNLGVLLVANYDEMALLEGLDPPRDPQNPVGADRYRSFRLRVELTNTGKATSAVFRADSLPPGVSMDDFGADVRLDEGETRLMWLTFAVDRWAPDGIWNAPHGVPYPIVVRYDCNGTTSWINTAVTIYTGCHSWSASGDKDAFDGFDWGLRVYMWPDGFAGYDLNGENHHLFPADLVLPVRLGDTECFTIKCHAPFFSETLGKFGKPSPFHQTVSLMKAELGDWGRRLADAKFSVAFTYYKSGAGY